MSRSSIYRLMKARKFPRRVKVGRGAVRWRESVIAAWVESLPEAGDEFDPPDST